MGGTGTSRIGEQRRRDVEHWFLQRGIPHFIHDYRATEDVFTRALPVLLLVVLLEVFGAADLEWRWWQNVLALLGGVAVLVGAWALVNRARGRPWHRRPDDVGPVELGCFVVLPALLPAIFGAQLGSAAGILVLNLVILGLVYLVASYGLLPMTRWAFGQMLRQLGAVADLFGRALPLLLLFTVALFVNTEVWQVASTLTGGLYAAVIAFFVVIGVVFLAIRLPAELGRLREQLHGSELVAACAGTPVENDAVALGAAADVVEVPLTRRQLGNVLLVLFFSQAVQVLLVTLAVAAFFFGFGLVAIRPEVVTAWLGDVDPQDLATWTVFGSDLRVTGALLKVSGFLGTLSGFYFTVYVITDATYREEFFTAIVGEVRQSLAVRNVYLALIDVPGGPDRVGAADVGSG